MLRREARGAGRSTDDVARPPYQRPLHCAARAREKRGHGVLGQDVLGTSMPGPGITRNPTSQHPAIPKSTTSRSPTAGAFAASAGAILWMGDAEAVSRR